VVVFPPVAVVVVLYLVQALLALVETVAQALLVVVVCPALVMLVLEKSSVAQALLALVVRLVVRINYQTFPLYLSSI
jgi:hypothetical protein